MGKTENKKHDPEPVSNAEQSDGASAKWSVNTRRIASLLIVLHLFAVIVSPLAIPPPSSELFQDVNDVCRPYLQATYLTHGYRFFAPNPGPSHIVRYEVIKADGTQVNGKFPDREDFWPRQLYHRWFMLSETLNMENELALTDEAMKLRKEDNDRELKRIKDSGGAKKYEWLLEQLAAEDEEIEKAKIRRKLLVDAIGNYLLEKYDGQTVLLFLRTREIPLMIDVKLGKKLDDRDYFNPNLEIPLGSITRESITSGDAQ